VNARCGLETTKGLGPCEGAEAFVVQKEPFPGMGREPISHILLQGRQTLEGVASLVFLSVRKDETRGQDIALWRWGTGAGLPKPSTSLERTDEDFGPKADWTGRRPGRRRRNSLPVREGAVKLSYTVPIYFLPNPYGSVSSDSPSPS